MPAGTDIAHELAKRHGVRRSQRFELAVRDGKTFPRARGAPYDGTGERHVGEAVAAGSARRAVGWRGS
jgi:hypothetical protein